MRKQLMTTMAALLVSCTVCGGMAQADYKNTIYTYNYKNGDYKDTTSRKKDYNGSDTPHGYAYAICGDGNDSSVKLMKYVIEAGTYASASEYVTIPRYIHTNIRNTFKKKTSSNVKLRVRDNTNHGSTGGYWSPDSSQKYNRVVG